MTHALLWLLLAGAPPSAQWLGPAPTLPATRVVTLAPSLTQTALALDAGVALVGVSRFDDAPEVAKLPRVGGFSDVSIESVVALQPQVVVVQKAPGNQKPVETLARLGVTVLALPLTTVDDVGAAVTELGRVLDRAAEAQRLVAALRAAREAARAQAKGKEGKRVLFVYGFEPLVVAGPGSFAHELLTDCGAVNVAARAPSAYPTYSLEKAVTLVPDVVVDASDVRVGREAVAALPPLKKATWVDLPHKGLLQPGPSLAEALPRLCALVR